MPLRLNSMDKDRFEELMRSNPAEADRLIQRVAQGRLYTALHLEDLQGLLQEMERVGLSSDKLHKKFNDYVRYDCDYPDLFQQVFGPLKEGCERDISIFLAHLQRRHKNHQFGPTQYGLSNESMHLAYIGVVEQQICDLNEHSITFRDTLKELEEDIIIIPGNISLRENLQQNIRENDYRVKKLVKYSDKLIKDCEEEKYIFRIPFVIGL